VVGRGTGSMHRVSAAMWPGSRGGEQHRGAASLPHSRLHWLTSSALRSACVVYAGQLVQTAVRLAVNVLLL
jgi:hypothetical protein